jgi:hypothetical protein
MHVGNFFFSIILQGFHYIFPGKDDYNVSIRYVFSSSMSHVFLLLVEMIPKDAIWYFLWHYTQGNYPTSIHTYTCVLHKMNIQK